MFSAFLEVDRCGENVDHRGIDAAPAASTETVELGRHVIGNASDRQLFGHESMIARSCLRVGMRLVGSGERGQWMSQTRRLVI